MTDLASYTALGTAIKFELETAAEQDFVAYWVDDDNGKPTVRKSVIGYKNFHLNSRIAGKLVDTDDLTAYAITGYYNSNKIVFSHRGPLLGTGVYILNAIQLDNVNKPIFAGYAIIDDQVGERLDGISRAPMPVRHDRRNGGLQDLCHCRCRQSGISVPWPRVQRLQDARQCHNGDCKITDRARDESPRHWRSPNKKAALADRSFASPLVIP